MITYIKTVLIPLAASNITIRREMEKTTALATARLEDKINTIMQRTIDVAIAWITKLLAAQKKSDFRPRDDALSGGGAWLEMLQTPVRPFPSSPHSLPLSNHTYANPIELTPGAKKNRPAKQQQHSSPASTPSP